MKEEILVDQHYSSKANRIHESFLVPFFTQMNVHFKDQWCVLHSYETLPFYSQSDVDMAFAGSYPSELELLILRVAKQNGWQVYQKLWYDVQCCWYFVLKENISGALLAIDFLIDNKGIGRYGFETTILTNNCDRFKEIVPIPNHEVAFAYKLVKRIEKGRSLSEDEEYLNEHYKRSNFNNNAIFLQNQYGSKGQKILLDYFGGISEELSKENIIFLKTERKKLLSNFGLRCSYFYWETKRVLHRFFNPSGLIITIPNMKKNDAEAFTKLLSDRVGILFRFVKLDVKNSKIDRFKGITGSTLVVRSNGNFKKERAVRYHGIFNKFLSFDDSENLDFGNQEQIVNAYYKLILKALSLRVATK